MHAYAIQPSTGLIKLDAMENPFRLPEALQRELGERLGRVAINRYPVRCVADVIKALSAYVKLPTRKGLRICTLSIVCSCCKSSVSRWAQT